MTEKKVRVLVIDDSAYNRQTIAEILASHPDIDVVGKASDGEEGLKAAAQLKPDLITLDLEMPRMDGFTFLRILMSKLPTPVIVISSHSKKQSVFQALELGALDFIAKPTRHISPDLLVIREELIAKVLLFRHLRMDNLGGPRAQMPIPERKAESEPKERSPQPIASELRIVCIGASTGGPPAIQLLLAQLPEHIPTCIVVCQHMPAKFTRAFAERLDKTAKIKIKEAEDNDPLLAGSAYITPGGGNMVIARVDGKRVLKVVPGEVEDRYVPSIDKLFVSVAETFGNRALGIVLTGMGTDGKVGAAKVRERGGMIIAEAKESAVIYGMPKEVIECGAADLVMPLPKIGDALIDYCTGKKLDGAQVAR
ncbi:MAG: chemotaxis response regulator protein-glutamate methylesterase [Deltaproteobacteria bacterium]|nr:chemotaxis response regulator protein-glutamate methylesterase [Deltaproteobacteria bacterium]